MSKTVMNYQTGRELTGRPSKGLITASKGESTGTGAVLAYRDAKGVWQHVADSEKSTYTSMGHKVVAVWVQS